MSATGEITTIGYRRTIQLGEWIARWARRRSVRSTISDVYLGDERRALLEERLLLERERVAAQRELDRTAALGALYRGV